MLKPLARPIIISAVSRNPNVTDADIALWTDTDDERDLRQREYEERALLRQEYGIGADGKGGGDR